MVVVNAIIDGKNIQRKNMFANKLKKEFLKKLGIGVKKQKFYDALKYEPPEPPEPPTASEILQKIRNRAQHTQATPPQRGLSKTDANEILNKIRNRAGIE